MRHATTIQRTKVFVIAPFLSQNAVDRPHLERLHQELKHLVPKEGGVYVSIIDEMTLEIRQEEGQLPIRIEKPEFFDDPVHLSQVGAKLLAQKLIVQFNLVPNRELGLNPTTEAKKARLSLYNATKRSNAN
ncbi:MAG: hypothetical protein FJ333_11140 [Sphingomonadales bacterium]|nr:hypothetical protein [Sphingomonadales bacterium]